MSNRDKIRVLSEREQARDKVSIFFGSRDNYYHPLKETLANGSDEITNNFETGHIKVYLGDMCDLITVCDSGRGIPLEGETDGVPNYELLLLKLFAGTNYDNNENGKITTGCNGVGLTVTNYCSEYFNIKSKRGKKNYEITFRDGATEISGLKKNDGDGSTGTEVTFKLDSKVFTNTIYDYQEVHDIIKKMAGVSNKITFSFEHQGKIVEFHYPSIEDYFNEITHNNTSKVAHGIKKKFVTQFRNEEDMMVDETNYIELLLCTSSEPIQESFLNITYLKDGGTINEGVINGTKLFVNKYCRENKLLDKKLGQINNDDVAESISFVCNVLSTNVEYKNQTKLETEKKLYKELVQDYTQEVLEIFKTEKPKEFEKMVKHILQVQKFNGKASENKAKLKKKLSEKVDSLGNRINGLVDCKTHGELAEIFICEGKSALGSVVLARNPRNQAAIAIRGKILNCLKANYDDIFKSEIIVDLVKALGCGIKADKKNKDLDSFDIKNLRFGKVILAADADADGQNIVCLLLTMIYRLMPDLIEEGVVYIANTPLYEISLSDEEIVYIFSEAEKEEKLKELQGRKYKIARCKGLGELDAETMSVTAMNPETRNLTKVTIGNVQDMIVAFEDFMGTDVTNRKEYITNNLNKYLDSID